DSFQLIPYLPHISADTGGLIDLGSGGGFPGMVLAASGVGPIRMIDSDQRKCQFLAQTSRKLGFKTEVITSRLEAYTGEKASCLTARAVAPLDKLFGWALPMLSDDGQMVLLKGGAWEDEVAQAQKHYEFDVQNHLSQTNADARILIISNLSHKG
ncbi:MAG: 16S rRNA (guanine(527)-N(7))-methyltransferase RsmG, partial [Alphaproteobacteria bacterium]